MDNENEFSLYHLDESMSVFTKKKGRPSSARDGIPPEVESIIIEDSRVFKPDFTLADVSFIKEIRRESNDSDFWSFEIHLKNIGIKRLMFRNKKEAEYLYSRLFDLLADDRKM